MVLLVPTAVLFPRFSRAETSAMFKKMFIVYLHKNTSNFKGVKEQIEIMSRAKSDKFSTLSWPAICCTSTLRVQYRRKHKSEDVNSGGVWDLIFSWARKTEFMRVTAFLNIWKWFSLAVSAENHRTEKRQSCLWVWAPPRIYGCIKHQQDAPRSQL